MLEIPFDPHFTENMIQSGDCPSCIICGRTIKKIKKRVRINSGFSHILTEEEFAKDEGQMGLWPIGPDCLKKHVEISPYIY